MNSENMICYNISTLTWVLILIFVGTYGAFKNFKTRQLYKEKTKIMKPTESISCRPSPNFKKHKIRPTRSHRYKISPSPSPSLSSNSSWRPSNSSNCSNSSSSSPFDSDSDFGF